MFLKTRLAAIGLFGCVAIAQTGNAQVRILFDATKAEMAGNADWVIDADLHNIKYNPMAHTSGNGTQSNPQQYPTPAQSAVTPATPETYWEGSLSSWGIDCVNQGYTVETLPYNGQITYNDGSNPQDLSSYKVYIVDEPNISFTAAEKTAIVQFVQHGGSLFMISDHTNSDRNNDGNDSPEIWDDLINNNSVQANPFGITFDLLEFSGTSNNVYADNNDPIIHGIMGTVGGVTWNSGTSMTLSPAQNATVKGVIFKNGSAAGNNNVLVAYAKYGTGKVAAMSDSSPFDDGTGNPDCTLYSSYATALSGAHRRLIMNITIWLASSDAASVATIENDAQITVFPNPSNGTAYVSIDKDLQHASLKVCDVTGKTVFSENKTVLSKGEKLVLSLNKGFYYVQVEADNFKETEKLVIY